MARLVRTVVIASSGPFARSGRWLKAHAGVGAGFLVGGGAAFAILAIAAMTSVRDVQQANDRERVAREWREAMLTLGIDPVFPPTEDFHVGDILAVDDGTTDRSEFLFRTIRIAHVQQTEAMLRDTYKDMLQFPPTPIGYDGTSPVEASGAIFDAPGVRKSLPIVAFPGVTISTASAQAAGGVLPWIRGLFGMARTASDNVQIKIPEAETYGIYAADAMDLLEGFCNPNGVAGPNQACSETGVRLLLASVSSSAMSPPRTERTGDPGSHAKSPKPPDRVGLLFVYRVFMTRSIDYVYGADTAVAATARSALEGSQGEPVTAATQSPHQGLDLARDQLRHELGDLGQGGQLSIASVTRNGVVLQMQLIRPVVIGYLAIKVSPWPNIAKVSVERSQAGAQR